MEIRYACSLDTLDALDFRVFIRLTSLIPGRPLLMCVVSERTSFSPLLQLVMAGRGMRLIAGMQSVKVYYM